ncbi:Uncharacterized protein Fot_29105 [Forsythia ovata]|uniref:Uncharacterized protein n=1 Tax=Forsythia ovata TaxID=205694 RepID=A0ABD1TQZ5_9LAMI
MEEHNHRPNNQRDKNIPPNFRPQNNNQGEYNKNAQYDFLVNSVIEDSQGLAARQEVYVCGKNAEENDQREGMGKKREDEYEDREESVVGIEVTEVLGEAKAGFREGDGEAKTCKVKELPPRAGGGGCEWWR